ncbi:MAG: V-type ATP synthase subunit E [Thermosphaera sp.]
MKRLLDPENQVMEARNRLIEEARRRANSIIEEAEREAESIIRKAEEEWERNALELKNRILEEARQQASLRISEAQTVSRLRISQELSSIIEELFQQADKELENPPASVIEQSLENLLLESLKYVDKPRKIRVAKRDVEIMKDVARRHNLNDIEIIPEDIKGGLILESETGIIIDNTYESRLAVARRVLVPIIRKKIWA